MSMIITKKAIPRRTILRGIGTTLSLPLLDAMVPALSALAATPAAPVRRLGIVYVAMGAVMDHWTPNGQGAELSLSPILEPLAPFRDQLLVLSGMFNTPGTQLPGEPAGTHGRVGGSFLTGVHVKPTEGGDFRAGISVDQVAASELGKQTELGSLELSLESPDLSGACDPGFSCAYVNTMCWRGPTTPLPMENNPRVLFERLFGDDQSADPAARLARRRKDSSLLDSVTGKVKYLTQRIGPADRAKLSEYLDAIRDVELRIQKAAAQSERDLPLIDQPEGIPISFEEHVKLMFDLQVLAYQSDLTRVITFMVSKELSNRAYPEIGVPDSHHGLSHHQDQPEKLAKLVKLQTFYAKMFAYYLERLQSTRDGDSSLLKNIVLLYGSGMSNSNTHDAHDLPILVAGGGTGQLKGGRHIRCPKDLPLGNLYVTLLNMTGVPVEKFGESTGALAL